MCLSVLIFERALRFSFVTEKILEHCSRSMPKIYSSLFHVRGGALFWFGLKVCWK